MPRIRPEFLSGDERAKSGDPHAAASPSGLTCRKNRWNRRRTETVGAGRATGAANRAKQIVPCGMIESAGQASVARLGSDGLMRFSTALEKAFQNTGCMAAILLERIKESPL
jgi:hypothetical protein